MELTRIAKEGAAMSIGERRLVPLRPRTVFDAGSEYDVRVGQRSGWGHRYLVVRLDDGIYQAWWEASPVDAFRLHGGIDRDRALAEAKLLKHIEDRLTK